MYAVETKYLGPTNIRGSRVSARFGMHRVTVSYRPELSALGAHRLAVAKVLMKAWPEQDGEAAKLRNPERWRFAERNDDKGYVFVYVGNIA